MLKSRLVSHPARWIKLGRVDPGQRLNVSIALSHSKSGHLEHHLLQTSDPSHPRYGQHLSALEVDDLIRPAPVSVDLVRTWLADNDVLDASPDVTMRTSSAGDWLFLASVPVHVLETLLWTEYFGFQDQEGGNTVIRALEWSLPAHLADHIDLIEPVNAFMSPRAQSKYGAPEADWAEEGRMPTYEELADEDLLDRGPLEVPAANSLPADPTVEQACNRLAISPLCLRVLYGTLDYEVHAPRGTNSIGIVNFIGEVANRSDIQLYLDRYRKDAATAGAATSFPVNLVAGGEDQQTSNTPEQMANRKGYEGALDAQTILGISWPVPMVTYNVGGKPPYNAIPSHMNNTNEPYLAWLQYMKTVPDADLPKVISISYAEDERTIPPEYARRVCAEFAQLGARGVSVLVATGDYGVGKDAECVALDGQTRRLMPTFPASCPWVTAVGASRYLKPGMEIVAFDARSGFSSAGGFSDVFSQPGYQRRAVQDYLDSFVGSDHDPGYTGLYDPKGRAYPDVSAAGYHVSTMWNGTTHLQDGTSASTPTLASIVALVNDALAAEGRPSLGFLNPWIYSVGKEAFKDVTWGSNMGCNSTGFPALEGWDPATGFGTPVSQFLSLVGTYLHTWGSPFMSVETVPDMIQWFPELKKLALRYQSRFGRPWYYLDTMGY